MDWGHRMMKDRVGKSGIFAERGDIVEVVKGRKYPIGMRFVVADKSSYCKYQNIYNGFRAYADEQLVFYDEGFRKSYINSDNVVIVAQNEDRENPEYDNVHMIEVSA